MKKVFGIDLGTTYSCIAGIDESEKPIVLRNSEDAFTTPSVVWFEDNNKVTVGEYAKESAVLYPLNVVQLVKRSMGQDGKVFEINEKEWRPEQISAEILKKLVKDATNSLREMNKLGMDEEIKDVVITCPAYFGEKEKLATENAGKIAGLNVLSIINEPTAAAINYGMTSDAGEKTILVYDLGGGTFDVTIMRIHADKRIEVIVTGGNHVLGGADWDKAIIDYVAQKFEEENGISAEELKSDPEALQELTLNAEKIKKMLSNKDKGPVTASYDGESVRVELTKEKFEELTSDLLQQTIILTNDTIAEYEAKGFDKGSIDEILLVGGSSKMPQVKNIIDATYGIDSRLYDPDHAVAQGAAIYADLLLTPPPTPGEENHGLPPGPQLITDVCSRTYGLEVVGDKISNVLFKNTQLPIEYVTKDYGPAYDDQSSVVLSIYESISSEKEIPLASGAYIGEAELILPPNTKNTDRLEITFRLNNKGLLEMEAIELKGGNHVEASFNVVGSMSDEEVEKAKEVSKAISVS